MRRVLWLLPLLIGGGVYALLADVSLPIVQLELAGSHDRTVELAGADLEPYRRALWADFWFIPGYVVSIVGLTWTAYRAGGGRLFALAALGTVVAGLFDIGENLSLLAGVESGEDALYLRGAVLAGVKFALLIPAALMAVAALFRRRPSSPDAAPA